MQWFGYTHLLIALFADLGQTNASCETITLKAALQAISLVLDRNIMLADEIDLDQSLSLCGPVVGWSQQLSQQGYQLIAGEHGNLKVHNERRGQLQMPVLLIQATPTATSPRPFSLHDERVSSTILDQQTLSRNRAGDLDRLLLRSANVFGNLERFYIRGIPNRQSIDDVSNAHVLWDGLPMPTHVVANLPIGSWNLASARFQRGSNSANALTTATDYAGAIQFSTPSAAAGSHNSLRLLVSDAMDRQLSASFNRSDPSQQVAARLSLFARVQDADRFNLDLQRGLNKEQIAVANGSVIWEPSAYPLSSELKWSYFRGRGNAQDLQISAGEDPLLKRGRFGLATPTDYDMTLGQWSWLYQPHRAHSFGLTLGLTRSQGDLAFDTSANTAFALDQDEDYRQLGLNWIYRPTNRNRFTAFGGSAIRQSARVFRLTIDAEADPSIPFNNRVDRIDRTRLDKTYLGLQLEHQFDFGLDSRLILRRDQIETDNVVGREFGFTTSTDASVEESRLQHRQSAWSPDIYLRKPLGRSHAITARWLRGYRPGGLARTADEAGDIVTLAYRPEENQSWEIGLEFDQSTFSGRALIFYSDYRDLQIASDDSRRLSGDGETLADGHSYGLEIDAQWQPSARQTVYLSLGYLSTHYDQHTLPASNALSVSGNDFAGAPHYSLALTYHAELNPRLALTGHLSYTGASFSDVDNNPLHRIPEATVLDLSLRYTRGPWSVTIFTNNALDESYLETALAAVGNQLATAPAPGRQAGVEVSYQF